MNIEARIIDPICIRLGKDTNFIMADEKNEKNHPLEPGVVCSGENYGFVLITDHNGVQKETVYATQCRIQGIGIDSSGFLRVFEESKKIPWIFSKDGKLEQSTFDQFTDEFNAADFIIQNYDIFVKKPNAGNPIPDLADEHNGEPSFINPIKIRITRNPEKSVILKDENIKDDYPLYPGAVIGDIHYGFVLIIDTEKGQKEVTYFTQNRIDAVGIEESICGDLKIYERGKYHPWVFTYDGNFKKEASYNPYSRKDKEFVIESLIGENSSETYFTLQKIK